MPKFFINSNQISQNKIVILGNDVNHIKNVLRKRIDDEILICNKDDSCDYRCKIDNISDDEIKCEILEKLDLDSEPITKVTIFQGLPKADKMELVIQKSVELGVFDITPVEIKRCVVKLNEKDKKKKIDRWQKISEVASKQSGRNIIPKINEVIKFKDICSLIENYDLVLVAYEKEKENSLKNELKRLKEQDKKAYKIGVIIGPEGGIDEEEINMLKEYNVKVITLGRRILRTETAPLNVLSNIMYELEK